MNIGLGDTVLVRATPKNTFKTFNLNPIIGFIGGIGHVTNSFDRMIIVFNHKNINDNFHGGFKMGYYNFHTTRIVLLEKCKIITE
jgi:hypothetical protein